MKESESVERLLREVLECVKILKLEPRIAEGSFGMCKNINIRAKDC